MSFCATDPVALTRALVRCPSVTPEEAGALSLLESVLAPEGFRCARVDRSGVPNLFARAGDSGPVLGFAGHTDVVPVGDASAWSEDPFGAEIRDGMIWGRGSVDMKSGVGAFVAAAIRCRRRDPQGSLSLLITGDEEGEAKHGTVAILDWMRERGERLDGCVVGEPSSRETVGDRVKTGRRGSVSFRVRATGKAGHSAYPERARNPVPVLARAVAALDALELDTGTEHFQPSTLAVTGLDTANRAPNVIPGSAEATVNIRFNDAHTADGLEDRVRGELQSAGQGEGIAFDLERIQQSEVFLCGADPFADAVCDAVASATGRPPERSTAGGTSDGRFIKDFCPVVEVGLVGARMHETDERVPAADVEALMRIYERVIDSVLAGQ